MGYIIYRANARNVGLDRWLILIYLFIANAPDLDFVPGLLIGDPNRYHHGISHSIGFAVLFATASIFVLFLKKKGSIGRYLTIPFFLYGSHLGLDYLSTDTGFPYGIPLFWPLSGEYYIASFAFLPDIQRVSSSNLDFFTSLFSLHNLRAVGAEFLLLFPFILLLVLIKKENQTEIG